MASNGEDDYFKPPGTGKLEQADKVTTPEHIDEKDKPPRATSPPPIAQSPSTGAVCLPPEVINGEDDEMFGPPPQLEEKTGKNSDERKPPTPPCVMNSAMWEDLDKDVFFHGTIPLEDVNSMLKKNGEFLVRKIDDEYGFITPVVTVFWNNTTCCYSMVSKSVEGKNMYTVDGNEYHPTPREAVRWHYNSGTPVFGSIKLLFPIYKQDWELSKEQLVLTKKIGEGAFGEVWSGTLNRYGKPHEVAVKLMNMTANTKANLDKMHSEARIHRQYDHKHIVRLFGILFTDTDVRIVMEMVDGGSLEKYLKNSKNISPLHPLQRASFSYDIAAGLAYLHSKKYMHRDIAARNCLVSEAGKMAKLSDFGLSVQGPMFKIPATDKIPVRWQAPEVLTYRAYYIASDIWSYGMLLWEIHNNATPPFDGIPNKDIRAKINEPTFRPQIAFKTPYREIYSIIKLCWELEMRKRPSMKRIEHTLEKYSVHPIQKEKALTVAQTALQKSKSAKLNSSQNQSPNNNNKGKNSKIRRKNTISEPDVTNGLKKAEKSSDVQHVPKKEAQQKSRNGKSKSESSSILSAVKKSQNSKTRKKPN